MRVRVRAGEPHSHVTCREPEREGTKCSCVPESGHGCRCGGLPWSRVQRLAFAARRCRLAQAHGHPRRAGVRWAARRQLDFPGRRACARDNPHCNKLTTVSGKPFHDEYDVPFAIARPFIWLLLAVSRPRRPAGLGGRGLHPELARDRPGSRTPRCESRPGRLRPRGGNGRSAPAGRPRAGLLPHG